jgi:hypothetical protein
MKISKVLKISPFFIVIVFLLCLAHEAVAITYYSSPTGTGTACSDASPCSLTTGLGKLVAGDTLYLKDGTYYQTLDITKSGVVGSPVIVKAKNDGRAIIDGQNARRPCRIDGHNDIQVEGVVCKNSTEDIFLIRDANRITVKRVSVYTAGSGNNTNWMIVTSNNVTLEDCVASNTGRVLYNVYESDYTTLRRCWGRWTAPNIVPGTYAGIQIYGSSYGTFENCVMTSPKNPSYNVNGISIFRADYNSDTVDNKFYGNVAYGFTGGAYFTEAQLEMSGMEYYNNVGIDALYGFLQRADSDLTVNNLTVTNISSNGYIISPYNSNIRATVKNSSFNNGTYGLYKTESGYVLAFNHSYNNLYGMTTCYSGTTQGTGENCKTLNPSYDTATYGKGAYLMVPTALKGKGEGGADVGAEVLYRYVDGKLTDTPLWPWPMEDRIKAETGYSVTWESGGGLWKTLEGVYESVPQPPSGDTTPPAPPAIMGIQ